MSDAASWDERYRAAEFVWSTQPNRFLPPAVEGLTPGRALDVACGEGRNAVWLATQGWEATGVDFSATGLEKAARLAETNNVTVEWICADVTSWESARSLRSRHRLLSSAARGATTPAALATAARGHWPPEGRSSSSPTTSPT